MTGFFGELYLRSTRPFLSEAVTQAEVAYLADQLASHRAEPVLDVGCGHGRHAVGLTQRGFHLFGIERDSLSLRERTPGFSVVRGDFTQPPFGQVFGAAYAWYSTLFVGSDEANQAALRAVAQCLRPGAALLLQTTPFEWLSANPRAVFRGTLPDGSRLEEENVFDASTGCEHGARRLYATDGRVLSGTYLTRHYPVPHLEAMGGALGLRLTAVHGDLDATPPGPLSQNLIVRFERAGE